ncbi:transporter [Penicillium frequentans]|nr:transporter [Penicillium glabrum]
MAANEESLLIQRSIADDQDLENGFTRSKIGTSFLAVMLLSAFLASSDDSFVLSTASDIAADFEATNISTWLITGFNLGYMVSLPIYGHLCDAWGRKRTYLFSYIVYGVGCLTMGTSLNIYMSILARIITGFGSSGMLDLSSVLLNDIGGPFGVAVLRSYFMTVTMIGFSAGGALGGFLATLVGWRWSFLLHVPIVFLCALVTVRQLPKDAPQDPQSAVLGDNQERQEEKTPGPGNMDIIGMILLVCAIVSALMMVQVLQGSIVPESKLYISTGLGLASLLLVGILCVQEVQWAKRPLIPLSFMMSSQTGIVCVVQILSMIADLAIVSTVSEYFVRTKGFSMAAASACLAPPALGGALGGYLAGRQIQTLVAPVSIQCLSTQIYRNGN